MKFKNILLTGALLAATCAPVAANPVFKNAVISNKAAAGFAALTSIGCAFSGYALPNAFLGKNFFDSNAFSITGLCIGGLIGGYVGLNYFKLTPAGRIKQAQEIIQEIQEMLNKYAINMQTVSLWVNDRCQKKKPCDVYNDSVQACNVIDEIRNSIQIAEKADHSLHETAEKLYRQLTKIQDIFSTIMTESELLCKAHTTTTITEVSA
jgi:hypothetical protein